VSSIAEKILEVDSELTAYFKLWLREYINEYCIVRSAPGTAPLKSPNPNDFLVWELYLSKGLYNSKFSSYVGMLFWEKYAEEYKIKPFQIAAYEPRGVAVLSAIMSQAPLFDIDINCFSIRQSRKEYALENIIEGSAEDLPVMIVNDTSNEDDSFAKVREVLAEEGLTLYNKSFSVVNKDVLGVRDQYDMSIGPDYKVESLFSIRDFDYRYNDYISRNERYVQ
jgi:hypothetical protein